MDQYIGKLLDNRYEILERIGTGGMAVVYKARCHRLNRLVAVKILKEDLAQDAEFRRRFHDESQAVAMLSHPNIVAVYDVSKSSELDYIVMELIDGITLKQYMQKKGNKLAWREALHFITQIMKALSHAHSRGIIHRDIKPHNMMVLRDGSLKVADFGIARLTSAAQATLTQEALGSVHYISPEQARGSHIDARSDLYSAGVVLYEMITGRLPYEGDSPVAVAIQHINSIPLSPREIDPEIPEALEAITMKAMASDVNQRYISADAMLADLEEFRKNPSINFDYTSADLLAGDGDEPTQVLGANTPHSVKQQPAHGRSGEEGPGQPVPDRRRRSQSLRQDDDFDYDEEDGRREGSRLPVLLAIGAIIVFLIGIGVFLWVSVFSGMLHGGTEPGYRVPNLTGMTVEDARGQEDVVAAQFIITPEAETVANNLPAGQIVSQSPDSGLNAAAGSTITVTISGGPTGDPLAGTKMPDLKNQDKRSAISVLKGLGFDEESIAIVEENSDEYTKDYIMDQTPAAGEDLEQVEQVTLVVSLGPKVEQVSVISFLDMTEEAARNTAESMKLTVGAVDEAYDPKIAAGRICYQSIQPNTSVDEGTTILFHVSLGPDPAATPEPGVTPTPGTEPGPSPSPSPTPDQVSPVYRTYTVHLPDDGRETVTVVIVVGDTEVYRNVVNTQLMVVNAPILGDGVQEVKVYIDDVLTVTDTVDFGS